MSQVFNKSAIALAMAFAASLPAYAVDNLTVDGYAKSSDGEIWMSGSGDCVRTVYQDSKELPEACGYKKVEKESVEVANQPTGAEVSIVKDTEVTKGGEVLAAKSEVVTDTFIKNLEFGFDSAELSAADKAQLDEVIAQLEPHRSLLRQNIEHVNVIGYTDSTGPEAYNQKLSERRAQAVADYLVNVGGVRREVLRVEGRGEADPIADNSTEEGRKANRRVVIEVVKD